jgi:peptide/nickel transport system substrate-binding protein
VPKLAKSDADLAREGALALATKYGEKPRYGGKLLANNWEPVPTYDNLQTNLGGVYVMTAPAYNGLLSHSPYDPKNAEIIPDLARTWELAEGGKKIIFHLAQGVRWHDGEPFSSVDVKYTLERIMTPPAGVLSHRGPIFNALIESFEAPDPNTVVINGKGASGLLVPLFANGWSTIYAKHFVEKDPVNSMKTNVMGTGAFRLKKPPTTTLWQYERNPDYFEKDLPYVDEIDYYIIQDGQAQAAALLTQKIYYNDTVAGVNWDPDLARAALKQQPRLILNNTTWNVIFYMMLNATVAPTDDLRVRQAISEALRREDFGEIGAYEGSAGTAAWPLGQWALPKEVQEKLIGYGPNMDVRIAHAKELLASYEAEKGKIDWGKTKIVCSSNIVWSCKNGEIIQSSLKKIGITIQLDPLDVTQHRGGEAAGTFAITTLGASLAFDDPVDVYGQFYVTKGGRWYQRSSIPELDALYQKQIFTADFEERRKLVWEMDKLAMNDAAWNILLYWNKSQVQWDFVKGFTSTSIFSHTGSRLKYLWLDLPEANRSSR